MKICFVRIMPYPYTIGGGSTHLRDLARALAEEGNEVHIISAKPEKDNREVIAGEKAIVHNVGIRHKKFSGKTWKLPFEAVRRAFFEISFMISSYKTAMRIKPDVIHCQTALTEAFPFALMGKPFVITEHGAHTKGMAELYKKKKNPVSGLGIWIYRQLEKFNVKRANKLICISEEAKEYYEKFGKRCEVIGNGIFLEDIIPVKKKSRQFFSLSRLSEQKGTDYLMEALSMLDKKGLKFEFWIGGDGEKDFVEKIKKKADELRNVKVKFLGFVTGSRKEELLKKGSVFVIPSRFEGTPITLLEAMSHNCAVVGSDCPGIREVVKPSFGVLVPFSDEKKRSSNLAKALEKALKFDFAKLGDNARKEAEKYDYRKLVQRYLKIYSLFLQRKTLGRKN